MMFPAEIYKKRREVLMGRMGKGIILLPGNGAVPRNYPANTYPFRQDSVFLYYIGIQRPDLFAILDCENGETILFGKEQTEEDILWSGEQALLSKEANRSGIAKILIPDKLPGFVRSKKNRGLPVFYLPQCRSEIIIHLSQLLGMPPEILNGNASETLIKAVVSQRSVKEEPEIREIEKSLEIAKRIHIFAMKKAKPGMGEIEIVSQFEGMVLREGALGLSFPPIFSVRGDILHNETYKGVLVAGKMVLNDSGAESSEGYASDITRTFPVSGKFSAIQRDIYEIVLKAQETAIENINPGVLFREVHLKSCKVIAEGLVALGLLRGAVEDIMAEGAHALFFPHGLGHMMGLDVHDMEGLGEDYVGYTDEIKRSSQFGLAHLRFARELKEGFVLTVEPGIYFIPPLVHQWRKEGKCKEFIRYDRVEKFLDFGGIRIEDDILVTETGCRILGPPIPRSLSEIEAICSG